MHSYLVLLFVLGITFNYGYAQINDESIDSRNKEQNSEKIQNPLQEIVSEVTADDDAVIETVEIGGAKVDKDEAAENSDKLLKDLESKFTATLLQFFDRDDLYKDARFRAIMDSLKTAVYTITGSVNHDYIQNIVKMVQKWDEEKRSQFNDIALNKLGMTETDVEEFVDKFIEGMKNPSSTIKSPRSLDFSVRK
ncbi:uncharacterized protein TNIN_495671 [Trichonephila inaurata madagascariensis]|uniref:Uncharacterized protein n=1 Tax=Trichonephila inaurata madagascariensis TaxID=2747483 RepID=A0A8X6XRG8_9ARAC|nr:uncharacterized protein TNIN_495671 [Trichonephila inaurata madagascariensis]